MSDVRKAYAAFCSRKKRRNKLAGLDWEKESDAREITLIMGRGVDALKPLVGYKFRGAKGPIGKALSKEEIADGEATRESVVDFVMKVRKLQAGPAGATLADTEGVFEGLPEKSMAITVIWFKSPREPSFQIFKRNMGHLAEALATAFAQKEVIVRVNKGGRETHVSASPQGAPPPGDAWDALAEKLIAEAEAKD